LIVLASRAMSSYIIGLEVKTVELELDVGDYGAVGT